MGLGPPICLDCMKVMFCKETYPHWTCSECNKNGHVDEGVGFLFCVTDAQLAEIDKRWNTELLKERKDFQEKIRLI